MSDIHEIIKRLCNEESRECKLNSKSISGSDFQPLIDLDDMKVEQLYMLEVLVNSIEVIKEPSQIKLLKEEELPPLYARIKFIDFPCIEIGQNDFLNQEEKEAQKENSWELSQKDSKFASISDSREKLENYNITSELESKSSNISKISKTDSYNLKTTSKTSSKSDSLKEKQSGAKLSPPVTLSTGKSCLFPMLPLVLAQQISRYPLAITVYRKTTEDEDPQIIIIGNCKIQFPSDFTDAIINAVYENVQLPVIASVESHADLTNIFHDVTGHISAFIRLSCFGATIVTQFQLLGPGNEEYIFRSSKKDNLIEQQKKKEFLYCNYSKGPYKKENIVKPMVHKNDISPLKPIIVTEDNTKILKPRTSLSGDKSLLSNYRIVPYRKYLKDCSCCEVDQETGTIHEKTTAQSKNDSPQQNYITNESVPQCLIEDCECKCCDSKAHTSSATQTLNTGYYQQAVCSNQCKPCTTKYCTPPPSLCTKHYPQYVLSSLKKPAVIPPSTTCHLNCASILSNCNSQTPDASNGTLQPTNDIDQSINITKQRSSYTNGTSTTNQGRTCCCVNRTGCYPSKQESFTPLTETRTSENYTQKYLQTSQNLQNQRLESQTAFTPCCCVNSTGCYPSKQESFTPLTETRTSENYTQKYLQTSQNLQNQRLESQTAFTPCCCVNSTGCYPTTQESFTPLTETRTSENYTQKYLQTSQNLQNQRLESQTAFTPCCCVNSTGCYPTKQESFTPLTETRTSKNYTQKYLQTSQNLQNQRLESQTASVFTQENQCSKIISNYLEYIKTAPNSETENFFTKSDAKNQGDDINSCYFASFHLTPDQERYIATSNINKSDYSYKNRPIQCTCGRNISGNPYPDSKNPSKFLVSNVPADQNPSQEIPLTGTEVNSSGDEENNQNFIPPEELGGGDGNQMKLQFEIQELLERGLDPADYYPNYKQGNYKLGITEHNVNSQEPGIEKMGQLKGMPTLAQSQSPTLEQQRARRRQKIRSIYRYTDGMYPGINIGHKYCIKDYIFVPKAMGWLWNTPDSGDGLKPRRGWKPGAINRTITKMIRDVKLAAGLIVEEVKEQKSTRSTKSSKRSRRPFSQRTGGVSSNQNSLEYNNTPKPPTLHVHKKDGAYFISMNPIKTESEEEEEEMPLMFKILPHEDETSTSSESSLEIEFTAPGAVRKRLPKPIMVNTDTQYSDSETIVETEQPQNLIGKKKVDTTAVGVIPTPSSTMASVPKDNKWDADQITQVSKIKK